MCWVAPGRSCNGCGDELMKYVFVHAVIGGCSWISCAGVRDDEAVFTVGVVLVRGVVWFAVCGVVVGCVLFGDGLACGFRFWMKICGQLGITVTKTCFRCSLANGKVE